VPVRAMVSTSVDMSVSSEVSRIFNYAAEEADSIGDSHIETTHLRLGILRASDSIAARLLQEDGVQLACSWR
jgi:ATP-dependent Clp protease ATP-binding subunit ClpA